VSEAVPTPRLEIERLTVAYGAGPPAVKDLSLQVADGEIVSLLGPSGCGKTTTMRAVAGLVEPTGGAIRIEGRDVTRAPPNTRDIGLVFQSYALFPHLTVFENVAFGLRLRKVREPALGGRVGEVLAMVGLTGFAGRLPRELSGGQQQRVALARAVAIRPRLLLLDEPLSNLDARLRVDMRGELARIQRESGVTMVYVTHDQAEALALSTRVVVMSNGVIEQIGTPEEVHGRPRTAFVARFMGFETILDAADGRWTVEGGADFGPAPAGAAGRFAWRPRDVAVGSGPFSGVVTASAFQGHSVEVTLSLGAHVVKAELTPDAARPAIGSTVAFDLPFAEAARLEVG
jgi:putative spermidine/putrescine transport system ATP-binding protein